MEDSDLRKGHRQALEADKAMLSGRPKDAIKLYTSAASHFGSAKASAQDPEALKILDILQTKYAALASQLQTNLTNNPTIFKTKPSPQASSVHAFSNSLANTLASARGIPINEIEGHYVNIKRRGSALTEEDLFTKYNALLESSWNKLQQSMAKTAALFDGIRRQNPSVKRDGESYSNTFESFYVVPAEGGRRGDSEEWTGAMAEIASSFAACESAAKRQKDVMRTGLGKLRQEVKTRESRRVQELENEIERLVAENEKLKISNGRLRSRWEGLKESARKRRDAAGQTGTIAEEEEETDEEDAKRYA
ncbi:hypothetical protein V1525DRAFT_412451 [Lipomyces kononenkoae]|uniref:Uncharacterized protein n=1 Tax=Lipomyces kononenkoae TaxID=34357 RepID=A0ACC3SSL8_LIPKO